MSVEIRTPGGKLIGNISDELDGQDTIMVGNKQVPLSDVYNDKKLRAEVNDSIKSEGDNKDAGSNQ
tara:strand:- start:995 stop:1192 length:198 start_codon:yes stop_codon:yes gene_type:complete